MFTRTEVAAVRNLLTACFNDPSRRAAREARALYIGELLAATMRDVPDIVDREAADWLTRLIELCGPHAEVADIARWYALERQRLEKLIHP
jgi:hypothetical protein